MHIIVFLGVLLFSVNAAALDCKTPPDCAELGFSQADNPDCAVDGYLHCPFDPTYKKCVNYNCSALGFTKSDKSSWCAEIAECKTDKSYTMCRTSCFAWDADTLSSLLSADKCKTITLLDDIVMPENRKITLAPSTIIEGGNHWLKFSFTDSDTSTPRFISLGNSAGLKNLKIDFQHFNKENSAYLIVSTGSESFIQNLTVTGGLKAVLPSGYGDVIFYGGATYKVSGLLDINLDNPNSRGLNFRTGNMIIENVHGSVIQNGSNRDTLSKGHIQIKNSDIEFEMGYFVLYAANVEVQNSSLEFAGNALFYETKDALTASQLTLGEGAKLVVKVPVMVRNEALIPPTIYLSGTSGAPAKLTIDSPSLTGVNVVANNTTDILVLNGVTYHPRKTGTTLLSEVSTSADWIKE